MAIDAAYLRARWPGSFGDAGQVSDFQLTEAIAAAYLLVNSAEFGTLTDQAAACLAAHYVASTRPSRADNQTSAGAGGVSVAFGGATPGTGEAPTAFLGMFNALKRRKVLGIGVGQGGPTGAWGPGDDGWFGGAW